MKKQQKWELLKYAYDNYPKGTLIKWSDVQGTVDGLYNFDGDGRIVDSTNFVVHNSMKFAEIIPEKQSSILDGKVAIQVNNEREFKLLMEHYESKGWKEHPKYNIHGFGSTHHVIEYNDSYLRMDESNIFATIQYNVIPFADFAKEVGITPPVFVMNDFNGNPLYHGDKSWVPQIDLKNGKEFLTGEAEDFEVSIHNQHDLSTRFSTREAAERWILEANKPKEIEIEIDDKGSVLITAEKLRINGEVRELTYEHLIKIYSAFGSLQPF